jgi:uncharacterized protein RhaS with RHS repeats
MKRKIHLIIIAAFLCSLGLKAQSIPAGSCGILYAYDAAGNRISQQYYCNNTSSTTQAKEQVQNAQTTNFLKVDALYPNPTTGKFTLTFAQPLSNATVIITDAGGSMVIQKTGYNGSAIEMDLSRVASGVYFIRISQPDGKYITQKVIKR